jgi:hypothetical protein
MSVSWQIITHYILHWFRNTWAPRIGLLSLVSGLQPFLYLDILPISRTFCPPSTPGWYHTSYKTWHNTATMTTPCPRTVYSRPADPLLPQQIRHADKHTTPAVTTLCLNALLLLETSNYASTANLRSLVSAHIVVSSKQQLKAVTWLLLVLPIVTCTCFLFQPWTLTTAKLRLKASVFDDEYLTTVFYSFARNGGLIHSIETWSMIYSSPRVCNYRIKNAATEPKVSLFFYVHGSLHRNINLIEITNRMQPCSRIYYSNVSQFEWSVLLTQYCAGGKIETNEMGRARDAYGGG